MSKKFIVSFVLLLLGLTGFFLRFGSVDGFATSWHAFANGNTWMPFTPYDSRIEKASKLKRVEATRILIDDHSLFWKGTGAMVEPRLGEDDELVQLKVISGGYGYSSDSLERDPIVSNRGPSLLEKGGLSRSRF